MTTTTHVSPQSEPCLRGHGTLVSRDRRRLAWPWRMAAAITIGFIAPPLLHAQQADRVRLTSGIEVPGEIVGLSPNGVELETEETVRKFAIESVKEVRFGDEPDALRNARGLLFRKDGAAALEELGKIEPDELEGVDREIQTELAFVKSAATARQSLATGEGLAEGQKAIGDFLTAHPRSHHLYFMQELLGDLLARQGKVVEAEAAYQTLEKGPPAVAVRAAILKAALLYRQQKYAEALRDYETAARGSQSLPASTGRDEPQDPLERGIGRARASAGVAVKREADLGRARCLVRLGKADDAITIVRQVLGEASPDDSDGLGRVFNTLGDAQRTASAQSPSQDADQSMAHDKDALISFLRVELVHNAVPDDHAEALFNLVELWNTNNKPERAREARQSLETTYPDSPWTKKLPPAKAP